MISIIIPTFNEEKNIERLVPYLQNCCADKEVEIIIADCGSADKTKELATSFGAKVIVSSCKGRAVQMNSGAMAAKYDILYFVHADSVPPKTFFTDIATAVKDGYEIGRYRTKFEGNKWLLKLNSFFTRFDWFVCYGGDQTLFITKSLFNKANGYDEKFLIMEEYDLVKRAKDFARYKIFPKAALVSTRKYNSNSWLQVQRANYEIVRLYKKGVPQKELAEKYNQLLKNLK
ncbi:MAG: TIGR04283 family arsenosugar biosynthesis glycosyltransferase [Sphingobacteriales bacterium]|nr:TIGR04283 family arsenosugar biosynthesis glycosyltransferase [Sphingobacteriales bacterium]